MIRALTPQDLSELAALRTRVDADANDRRRTQVAIAQLYPHLLLDTPWYNPDIPSLVNTADGRLTGMLAVSARPMLFEGRMITAAIGTDLYVAGETRGTMAGLALPKALLNGNQDITFCDVANDKTRRIWERFGGFAASAYNLNWIGVFRPCQLAACILSDRRGLGLVGRATMTVSPAIDRIVPKNLTCSIDPVPQGIMSETLTPETFSQSLPELTADHLVRPVYSREATEWLWKRLPFLSLDSKEVSAILLRNSRGKLLGWYIYHVTQSGIARVSQIAAKQADAQVVINHLFARVFEEGAAAIAGRMQPHFQQCMIDHNCLIRGRESYTLVHSRDRRLAEAFRGGHAWLTVVDGEAPLNVWSSPEHAIREYDLPQLSGNTPESAELSTV